MDYCNCEETRDEFGGCVPTADRKTCMACGKKIPKDQILIWKQRMLREYGKTSECGWEKEFEDEYKSICGYNEEDGICLEKTDIQNLFEVYINGKVKIKCKDGLIQIERIK